MLKLNNLALRRGTRLLLERVNLDVFPGQRLGLTGANGSGKSSLFSVIAGRLEADQGSVTLPRGTLISEVMQETPQSADSAIEYVIDGDQQFRAVERHIRRAEQANDGARLAEWHDNLEQIDGFTVSARAGQLLHGLGFTAKEQHQSVNTFSGGWRMRLNLAQSLMTRADLLLLDEPTNHLDLDAMVWLERWLSAYDGIVLVISHDREFLDRSVSRIAHIEGLTLTVYEGNYSQAESRRAAALEAHRKQHASQQRKIAHMRSFVDRFRYKATKARQAQSRLKALERLETVLPVHERTAFVFEFEPAEQMPHQLMDLERVDAGYDHAILSNVNFRLAEGARIGLLGRNGAGKTTLMKVLASRLEPLAGSSTSAAGIRIGYFAQHQLELLDPERSPLEHLTELAGQGNDRRLRAFLGRFGFGGDAAGEPVGLRSGGEKARLVLALIVYARPNLLLLDEPTNHLDIDMRQSICMALQTYRGCLVVVAHDRHLLRLVANELWVIDEGKLRPFEGDLDDYVGWLRARQRNPEEENVPREEKKTKSSRTVRQDRARQRAQVKPLRDQVAKLEQALSQTEEHQQSLEQKLADPDLYNENNREQLRQLLFEQARNAETHQELEAKWLEAAERLDEASANR